MERWICVRQKIEAWEMWGIGMIHESSLVVRLGCRLADMYLPQALPGEDYLEQQCVLVLRREVKRSRRRVRGAWRGEESDVIVVTTPHARHL